MSARRPYDTVKRCLDVTIGGVALVVSVPVQLVVGALVARNLGRPVLFRQDRPGLNGEIFTLYKFRTMKEIDPERGLVSDADRLTSFGKSLRASSLDELPSLWNVVKGDMSLVGPRPLLPSYLELYSPEQARRHEVRPGLTGYAQISGRNGVGWDARLALDTEYVDRRSFQLDVAIVLQTMLLVLRREGIAAPGSATMSRFAGSHATDVGQP